MFTSKAFCCHFTCGYVKEWPSTRLDCAVKYALIKEPQDPNYGLAEMKTRKVVRVVTLFVILCVVISVEGMLRFFEFRFSPEVHLYQFVSPEMESASEGIYLEFDPLLFWRLKPCFSSDQVTINSHGFRGRALSQSRPAGLVRIVCLGCSTTFGLGVEDNATYPAVLETFLGGNGGDRRYEVINCGVPGYTSYQTMHLFQEKILPLEPDIVVLLLGTFNDWVPAVTLPDLKQSSPMRRMAIWMHTKLGSLRIYQSLEYLLLYTHRRGSTGEAIARKERSLSQLVTANYSGERRVSPEDFKRNLTAVIRKAEELNIEAILVVPPLPSKTLARNPLAYKYMDAVREVASVHQVPFVDAFGAFVENGESGLFFDFCHPNIQGNRLLAKGVAHAIRSMKEEK